MSERSGRLAGKVAPGHRRGLRPRGRGGAGSGEMIIAATVVFLAGDASRLLTGSGLAADGGYTTQ